MKKPILIPGGAIGLSEAQQNCVDILREALEQAEMGKIYSIGIILCMHEGYAATIGGSKAAELNLGCDSLKAKILREVEKPAFKL
jgi:hypothetical protein